jgi:hypothetical protein
MLLFPCSNRPTNTQSVCLISITTLKWKIMVNLDKPCTRGLVSIVTETNVRLVGFKDLSHSYRLFQDVEIRVGMESHCNVSSRWLLQAAEATTGCGYCMILLGTVQTLYIYIYVCVNNFMYNKYYTSFDFLLVSRKSA